jgi:hypothetical protein
MKPVITKIKFTKQEQEEIDLINKGQTVPTVKTIVEKKTGKKRDIVYKKRFTYETGNRRLVQLYGGKCCVCGQWPTYTILYDVEGAKRVERYCEKCYNKK